MSTVRCWKDGRRWVRTAVLVLFVTLLVLFLSGPPPAAASSTTATLTIVNETNPDGASGFDFTVISPELIWGWDVVAGGGTGFEVCTPGQTCKGGLAGGGLGQFDGPVGVAVHSGSLFVADAGNHRVQKYALSGAIEGQWGGYGHAAGQLIRPHDVAVDATGNVYVTDGCMRVGTDCNSRIQKFSNTGTSLGAWCGQGTAGGQFHYPVGIALDTDGNIYAMDHYNHRIQKFDSNVAFLRTWGWDVLSDAGVTFETCTAGQPCKQGVVSGYGWRPGGQIWGYGVVPGTNGRLYEADASSERIQVFDLNGAFLFAWGKDVFKDNGYTGWEVCSNILDCQGGTPGSGDGEFSGPFYLALDADNNVYVTDRNNGRVQVFDEDGKFLMKWGSSGGGAGQMNGVMGIALDAAGNVYVSEHFGKRVQKFSRTDLTLSDDQSEDFADLAAGEHLVSVSVPDGWYAPQVSCVGASSAPEVTGSNVKLVLGAGEEVTCTFTQDRPNQAPVATDDDYTAVAGQTLVVPAPGVLGNDDDDDGDPLTAVLVNDAAYGDLALASDGSFTYTPDPGTVGADSFTYVADDGSAQSNEATVTLSVIYDFAGFFAPVENPPALNRAKAGSGVPIKFSLRGDYGLDIVAAGYPRVVLVACPNQKPPDEVVITPAASQSGLHYAPEADQYIYVWKTVKAWGGTCQQFELVLNDGTRHMAEFVFK